MYATFAKVTGTQQQTAPYASAQNVMHTATVSLSATRNECEVIIHIKTIATHMAFAGASVLVFSIDKKSGTTYFLLGREQFVRNWSGSEKWSDFGGSRAANEHTPELTAGREFYEETLGVVPFFRTTFGEHHTMNVGKIQTALRDQAYTLQVTMSKSSVVKYVTFVKQIDWCPQVVPKHRRLHMQLRAIRRNPGSAPVMTHPAVRRNRLGIPSVPRRYLEKTKLQWWSEARLRLALSDRGPHEVLEESFRRRIKLILYEMGQLPGTKYTRWTKWEHID